MVLRIGKLHVEMKMARYFIDLNWDIFLSKLASELGFVSEAAQKFVRRGSDHHKTMSVLKVAHIGLWKEMLIPVIPYVRDRPSSSSPLSVIICMNGCLRLAGKMPLTTISWLFMFSAWVYM